MPIHVKPTKYLTDDGGWVHQPDECRAPMHCRPVVVIDPTDSEAVQHLANLFGTQRDCLRDFAFPAMQAALREYAKPTPPKPPEPTGMGAVVEDAEGERWVRVEAVSHGDLVCPWRGPRSCQSWRDVSAVRVLSEGVNDA